MPVATSSSERTSWIHYWALLTAVATLGLLAMGGLVTSHGAGLAVPDWPNTFGYNMFLFPISRWVGGVFYEHVHRLWASGVGLLTIVLAIGLARTESRRWVRTLGWTALVLVIFQGILGGLRVTLLKDQIGIFHACLAQTFFVLIGLIALFTSTWWRVTAEGYSPRSVPKNWFWKVLAVCGLIFVQLILGASMRHAHLGLSIPDYPLSYGRYIPPMDGATVERINERRLQAGAPPTTAVQIGLQFTHRLVAVSVLFGIALCADALRRQANAPLFLRRLSVAWLALAGMQLILGAATVWTNKAADVATAHVALGAITLVTGVLLAACTRRIQWNFLRIDDNRVISNVAIAENTPNKQDLSSA